MATEPANALSTALEVLSDDDPALAEVRARAVRFVDRLFTKAERHLETATPEIQAQMIRSTLPAIMKELQPKDGGDDLSELRQQQTELMAGVREALTSTPVVVVDAPAVEAKATKKPARKTPARKKASSADA